MILQKVKEPTLENITTFVKSGELLAVVGTVGSGKVIAIKIAIRIEFKIKIFHSELIVDVDFERIATAIRKHSS